MQYKCSIYFGSFEKNQNIVYFTYMHTWWLQHLSRWLLFQFLSIGSFLHPLELIDEFVNQLLTCRACSTGDTQQSSLDCLGQVTGGHHVDVYVSFKVRFCCRWRRLWCQTEDRPVCFMDFFYVIFNGSCN